MTEIRDINIDEAVALIDNGLGLMTSRELMSAAEMSDLLLDVRMLLMAAAEEAERPAPAPVS